MAEIIVAEGGRIPYPRRIKLLDLVCDAKSRALMTLAAVRKRELLQNMHELLNQGHGPWAEKVCRVLCREVPGQGRFPRSMIETLVVLVNAERSVKVRQILWELLLRKEIRLEAFATPEQVISGFWESDPIVLIRVSKFFQEHFDPDHVIKAAISMQPPVKGFFPGRR